MYDSLVRAIAHLDHQLAFQFEFGQNQTGYILIQTTAQLEREISQTDELSAGQWRCALPSEARKKLERLA
jgi:hypothetical protein